MEGERLLHVVDEDFHLACRCASRKCGPHRCWPSLAGWCCLAGLMVCLLVLLSMDVSERAQEKGDTRQQAIEASQESVQASLTTWNASEEKQISQLQEKMEQVRASERLIQQDLLRAEALRWAMNTPDLERDTQLKASVGDK